MADPQNTTTQEITLGQAGIETSNFDRYKGVKGRTDRIAFIGSTLIRGHSFYKEKRFLAPKNDELRAKCEEILGPPDQQFALVVFHYTTDEDGNLLDEEKCSGKVKIWRWSESKYDEYSALGKKWPIMDGGPEAPQHDLLIKCVEEKYQRMTTTVETSAHWKKKPGWYKALKEKALQAQKRLSSSIGIAMEDEEIRELLGLSGGGSNPTGGADSAGAVDLSDVVEA